MTFKLKRLGSSIVLNSRSLKLGWDLQFSGYLGQGRLIILDPGYIRPEGHHSEFNDAIYAEATRRCTQALVVVNAHASRTDRKVKFQRPLFRVSPYRTYSGKLSPSETLLRENEKTYNDMRRLSKIGLRPNDRVLWHTITTPHLSALARWYCELDRLRRPQLVVQLQYPVDFFVPNRIVPVSREWCCDWIEVARRSYLESVSLLRSAGEVRLITNSRLLQRHYGDIAFEPTLVGLPIVWRDEPSFVRDGKTLCISFLGGARFEKGFGLLPEVIAAITAEHENIRFVVQCPNDGAAEVISETKNRLAKMGSSVSILQNFVSRDRYLALLHQADCVLLPYDPERYRLRTSGILIEALGAGRPVLTTRGSWMASVIEEHRLPPLFSHKFDSPSLVAALRDFIEAPSQFGAAYAAVAPQIRGFHNPVQFLNQVDSLF